jgi:hypothetical protein
MERLIESFKYLDFFQREVVMNIDDKTRHRTGVGLGLTIMVIGFLSFSTYFLGSDIYEKKLPSVVQKKSESENPEDIVFQYEDRYFAFSLQNYETWTNWIDETIYHVEI